MDELEREHYGGERGWRSQTTETEEDMVDVWRGTQREERLCCFKRQWRVLRNQEVKPGSIPGKMS